MKKQRVDCVNCQHFQSSILLELTKAKCELGKRIMFRKPKSQMDSNYGYIRLCNDFKEKK